MSYIAAHRAKLGKRHYITKATSGTHWYNFFAGRLDEYRQTYGDEFCLVINCSDDQDTAYVLPFKEVKEMFSPEYLNGARWVGNVINDNLTFRSVENPCRKCTSAISTMRLTSSGLREATPSVTTTSVCTSPILTSVESIVPDPRG